MILARGVNNLFARASPEGMLTLASTEGWDIGKALVGTKQSSAMKISAVNACVEIMSNSMGKLPVFLMDSRTKKHIDPHPTLRLLTVRPNEAMTPFVFKKLIESHRLLWGNAYVWVGRNSANARPDELIILPPEYTFPHVDDMGRLWYIVTNAKTGEQRKVRSWDMIHLKAYSEDGVTGISVLARAQSVIETALQQQRYEEKFFRQGARPSGIVSVPTKLDQDKKNKVRDSFERMVTGIDGAFRVAVLDLGMSYTQLGISNADAQFVESKSVSVEDIARFFGVPLYKLQAGKQAYNSNEQNAIEYVVATLHPAVQQYEEEYSYKMLFDSELAKGWEYRINLNAELRGDFDARAKFYEAMRGIGGMSANDIRALEDMPSIPGGDIYLYSKNYDDIERLGGEVSGNQD